MCQFEDMLDKYNLTYTYFNCDDYAFIKLHDLNHTVFMAHKGELPASIDQEAECSTIRLCKNLDLIVLAEHWIKKGNDGVDEYVFAMQDLGTYQ